MGLIDVDGIRLNTTITGSGAPPVVCVSGLTGSHSEWQAVRDLFDDTTMLTYGRPGLGGSDPLPGDAAARQRGPRWVAHQLHALLSAAGIEPPTVLAGHSVGGWIVDQFVTEWPAEVGGVVLLDPTNRRPWPAEVGGSGRGLSDDDDGGIQMAAAASYDELKRSTPSPYVPAVVISTSRENWVVDPPKTPWYRPLSLREAGKLWAGFQREWVQQLGAVQIIANDDIGHLLHKEAPELVRLAIEAVVRATRESTAVDPDPAAVGAAGGRIADPG